MFCRGTSVLIDQSVLLILSLSLTTLTFGISKNLIFHRRICFKKIIHPSLLSSINKIRFKINKRGPPVEIRYYRFSKNVQFTIVFCYVHFFLYINFYVNFYHPERIFINYVIVDRFGIMTL